MASPARKFESRRAPALWLLAIVLIVIAGQRMKSRSSPADDGSILHRRITNVDFDGTPLNEALHQLAVSTGTTIFPNPEFLAGSETWGTPVYLHLHDVELGVVFDRMKGSLAYNWTLEERGGKLYLSHDKTPPCVARLYDVHDLVDRWRRSPFCLRSDPRTGLFGNSRVKDQTPSTQDLMEDLVKLITDDIEVEKWAAYGGTYSIKPIGKAMYISVPEATHRRIVELLRRFREAESAG